MEQEIIFDSMTNLGYADENTRPDYLKFSWVIAKWDRGERSTVEMVF